MSHDPYELAEYELDGVTYQFEVGKQPAGAKRVSRQAIDITGPEPEGATALDTQELGNVLEETARGQAAEHEVKAARKRNKAAAPEGDK